MEIFLLCFKLVVALVVVLGLMYLLYIISDTKIKQMGSTKYIKVLERTQISKDGNLLLVKLGDKGYVMSASVGKTEIIKELNEDEVANYEANKIENSYDSVVTNYFKKKQKQKDENYE